MSLRIIDGHCLDELKKLPDESVHCCVTSPPYWNLRDYKLTAVTWPTGWVGQHGLEPTIDLYVEHEVLIFREVRRVLRSDGTLWLNLGDCYSNDSKWGGQSGNKNSTSAEAGYQGQRVRRGKDCDPKRSSAAPGQPLMPATGLKPKDLCGLPWRVALDLQADGWFLRCDIVWAKANPMPESVTDRPTKSHEYIFLLTKSQHYFYDHEAIKEPVSGGAHARGPGNVNPTKGQLAYELGDERMRTRQSLLKYSQKVKERAIGRERSKPNPSRSNVPGVTPKSAEPGSGIKANESFNAACVDLVANRNKRSVWTVATAPFKGSHFATFPPALILPCILAGTSAKGCCSKCGSPWERIVQNGAPLEDWKKQCGADSNGEYNGHNQKNYQQHKAQSASTVKARILAGMVEKQTIGWKPTCECGTSETVPCTVLDPFGGSLTTAQVSLDNGRACIIIDLNPEYIQMGKDRLGLFQNSI